MGAPEEVYEIVVSDRVWSLLGSNGQGVQHCFATVDSSFAEPGGYLEGAEAFEGQSGEEAIMCSPFSYTRR